MECAFAHNWAEVAEEEVSSQEFLHTETMLADACREHSATSFTDDTGSLYNDGGDDTITRGNLWWVETLFSAVSNLGYDLGFLKNMPPWKVISGCTGISAETWVMKAGAIPFMGYSQLGGLPFPYASPITPLEKY